MRSAGHHVLLKESPSQHFDADSQMLQSFSATSGGGRENCSQRMFRMRTCDLSSAQTSLSGDPSSLLNPSHLASGPPSKHEGHFSGFEATSSKRGAQPSAQPIVLLPPPPPPPPLPPPAQHQHQQPHDLPLWLATLAPSSTASSTHSSPPLHKVQQEAAIIPR